MARIKLSGSWATAWWLHETPGCANSHGLETAFPENLGLSDNDLSWLGAALFRRAHSCKAFPRDGGEEKRER